MVMSTINIIEPHESGFTGIRPRPKVNRAAPRADRTWHTRAMDLKQIMATLAVLGSGATLACDSGDKPADVKEVDKAQSDEAKPAADAKNQEAAAKAEGEKADEAPPAEGDTPAAGGGDAKKGEGGCAPGGCAPGMCGANKDEGDAKADEANAKAAESEAAKDAPPADDEDKS